METVAQWDFPEPFKWPSILNKCLLSFKSKGQLAMELFNFPSSGKTFVTVLIFKENSSTSCLLICCLTLTELIGANESLSRTFPAQQMSFSKQRQGQLLPQIFRSRCHLGGGTHWQWCFTQGQRGLSPLKHAAVLRGPHCTNTRPSPVC